MGSGRILALLALVELCSALSCVAKTSTRPKRPSETVSAENYVNRAVRESAQGVVIFDVTGQSSGMVQDRLREIAHELRAPAATCFLGRAIETIELDERAATRELKGVPAGQIKFRVRLRPDGSVAHSDILENGFIDPTMAPCLQKIVGHQRFPLSPSAMPWFVDLVYWVSLGFHSQVDEPNFVQDLRRQVAIASTKATGCLRQAGMVPGRYAVHGLSLVSPEGLTMINRMRGAVPEQALTCLETVYRHMRVAPERDSFARPIFYTVDFSVLDEQIVTFADAEWVRLLQLEEAAQAQSERGADEDAAIPVEPGEVPAAPSRQPSTQTPSTQTPSTQTLPATGVLRLSPRPENPPQ